MVRNTSAIGRLLFLSNPFAAIFEGNGHTVSNLFIDTDNVVLVGLFGYASSSIRNMGVIDVDVKGADLAGGLIGFNARRDSRQLRHRPRFQASRTWAGWWGSTNPRARFAPAMPRAM